MSENTIQQSLQAGELSPSMLARTDLAKYHTGAARMRNYFVDYRSGCSSRPGTRFVIQARNSTQPVRLISFQYSILSSYSLEFGDFYVRFISDGSPILESGVAITGITNALPGVVTVPGNTFAPGDWVFITDVVGMTGVNGRYYYVQVAGADLGLYDVNGFPVSTFSSGAYVSGGTISRIYTIASPYAAADLALLKYIQSASVMTLTHPAYATRTLTITNPVSWAFSTITIGTTVAPPTGLGLATSSAGSTNYAYTVTSVDANGQESLAATPAAIGAAVNVSATAGTITFTWIAAAGAISYNIYKAMPSFAGAVPAGVAYGYVGTVTGTTFIDSNIQADYSETPPIVANPFSGTNYPSCACYFQQRAYYAASIAQPETFWASQPGAYNNFNVSNPTQADDAITGTLVSLQVNAIKWMLPMPGGLVIGTAKGAWQLSSGSGTATTGAVTPINATATPQAYNGAGDVPPLVINYDIVYIQAKGSVVRDLAYNIQSAIYTGMDISILSNHLFFDHQVLEWAYSEEPYKLIWAVREDGIMLSCTFVKEQEIYGWARHDTLGVYESVASVTEGQFDAVYVVVERYIGGRWIKMIERFDNRTFEYGAEDAWCVDCGVQSSLPTPAAGLTMSASTGIADFITDAAVLWAVNDVIRAGGGIARITAVTSPTLATGTFTRDVVEVLPNSEGNIPLPVAAGSWSLARPSSVFYGLEYLEGQTVSILADGGVVTPQVVTNGAITLASPATKVTAGLGFVSQLQTMYLDTGEPTIQGKRKKISALTIRCTNTRGLSAGRTFETVSPIKELNPSVVLGQAIPLVTGDERIVMDPLWDVPGQVCIEGSDPLPSTILGIIPEIIIGDTK